MIDTAGRLQIDEKLMGELREVKALAEPNEILLVVDAMIGQEAANVAREFNEQLEVTGVILTKIDGDTRGGAALSVRQITTVFGSGLYSPLQWTVQSATVDCTVCCRRL